ncbi:hypothetical protein HKX48_002867, partial [Thoreauomyces humboldtii]
MTQHVLPRLITKAGSDELPVRHGCMLAIGEICYAWSRAERSGSIDVASPHLKDQVDTVIVPISKLLQNYPSQYLDGFGGDLTRSACCRLIACLALSDWPHNALTNADLSRTCWETVMRSLEQRNETVQVAAATAVGSVNAWQPVGEERLSALLDGLAVRNDKYRRRGFALALGALDGPIVRDETEKIFLELIEAVAVQTEKTTNDAESRRNAVQAIGSLCNSLGPEVSTVIAPGLFQKITTALLAGLDDYSTDSRGDVGSWVRQACIETLQRLAELIALHPSFDALVETYWPTNTRMAVVGAIAKQAVEKIDRMREAAGTALMVFLWDLPRFEFEGRETLRGLLPRDRDISWSNASEIYPAMVPVLAIPQLRVPVLTGLVVSIGGLSESL